MKCSCGREFHQEASLLQHQRDAHGLDTNDRLKELTDMKKEQRREAATPQKKSFNFKKYGLVTVIALVVLGIVFTFASPTGEAVQNTNINNVAQFDGEFLMIGDPDAPNVIEEFGDYECPFCMRFHQSTFPRLKQEFIDTGKAVYIFKDFPQSISHFNAQKASEAAHCAAEQGEHGAYHDLLYDNSYIGDRWSGGRASQFFKQYAEDLGLDVDQFSECLDNGSKRSTVRANLEEGQQRGVRGTPSFFVNGQLVVGAQSYTSFARMLTN